MSIMKVSQKSFAHVHIQIICPAETGAKSLMFGLCRRCCELVVSYSGERLPQPC